MLWPAFAGKTYDFIIFQGDKQVTAQQDTIAKDGSFVLSVPQKYAPYTGMSRWLITGTTEGGGLDMAIPGYDFSVTCLNDKPDNANITYTGFDAVNELNRLHGIQQVILEKFETMSKATQLYNKKHKLYKKFEKEKEVQVQAYNAFQKDLEQNTNFNARFLPIVNLTKGIAPKLYLDETDKFNEITRYFAYDLDIEALYTSGHWSGIIGSWVQIHLNVIKDDQVLYDQFTALTQRIKHKKQYTDLTGKVTYYMKTYGMDKQIELITPVVVHSGKITEYVGVMELYINALTGLQAPDLVITEHIGKLEDHNHKTTVLKSSDLATDAYKNSLLVFYQSGCGPCEELMQELLQKYKLLKEKGIRVITLSADEGELLYKNSSKDYPWPDKYCDFEGQQGVNFKNYAVKGTPNLYILDKKGIIIKKMATMKELMPWLDANHYQ